MDNLELLSNDELRLRLLQYGFANLPVTQTTRNVLIKKLRTHLALTNKNLRKTTSIVTRYSSGEDSDITDGSKNVNKVKKSRVSVSGSPSTYSKHDMLPPQSTSFRTPSTNFTNRSLLSPSTTVSNAINNRNKKSSVYVSPVIINDSEDDSELNLEKSFSPSTSYSYISPVITSKSFNNKSTNSRTTDHYNSDSSLKNGYNGSDNDYDDDSFTSGYTKRLLQFRGDAMQKLQQQNVKKRKTNTHQPVSENDIVYHADPSSDPVPMPLNTAIKNFINRLDEYYGFKQTLVPYFLLSVFVIFFLLIIFVYMTIRPDIENTLSPSTTSYIKCNYNNDNEDVYACIDESSLESSLTLLKYFVPELQSRAVLYKCDKSSSLSNILCANDLWTFINEHKSQRHNQELRTGGHDIYKDLHNVEYLVDRNKQWGIQNVDENGVQITLNEVVTRRAQKTNCLAILKPKLPLMCIIQTKLQTFFVIVGSLAIIATVFYVVRRFIHFVIQVKETRRNNINQLINEIISSLLEKTMCDKENPVLVINHLRDKLVDPTKRNEMEWAWNEAIRYLEMNDSRIQFEIKNINGEDFKVIRWIDDTKNVSGNVGQTMNQQQRLSHASRYIAPAYNHQTNVPEKVILKKWNGPAFSESNKIKDPPTNCLKIRNMFDKYETNDADLHQTIQDSILLKLSNKKCHIHDIQLDLKSCCVYVKCASTSDAGIVHDEINGWWLENRLVSIKFLRLDRYNQRFPNSSNLSTCLYPSSASYVDNLSNGRTEYYDNENNYEGDDN